MRERLAKWLAGASALVVVALAAVFSLLHNASAPALAEAERKTAAAKPAAGAGRAAYERHGCARCHAIAGQGNPRNPLDGVGGRLTPAQIRDWTVAAPAVAARLPAPVAALKQRYAAMPEDELRSLVDYLSGLGSATQSGSPGSRPEPAGTPVGPARPD
jgi:cbb3-type cytochrome oxidase cytochrome c subunit